ncbi:transcriptional regulator [Pilimelia terevasa]|uniref:Transcriptional regulator n=1 Tax=Pilimelia terevasa TaxID=53372 RepID=A0A8J3BPF0_9ACTN|nr:Rv2175c family DNA-binding protein [Pilimelia terevasa]GGK26246.1 transcriptional regulator [Pilimelia terevasa]
MKRPAGQPTGVEPTASGPAAVEPAEWVPLPDVAERLDLTISRVRQYVRDGTLLAVRRDGVLRVPGELIANPTVLKHLPGVLTVLRDNGYNEDESLRWLYASDDSLQGGCPARALGGPEAVEVRRRAQALGY